jgi:hypothetical protein
MKELRWLALDRFPDAGLMSMLASFFDLFLRVWIGGWHLDYPKSGVILTFRLKLVVPSR